MKTVVYSLYTPLRNCLRNLRLDESLLGIHAHSQFLQFFNPLPQYIVGDPPGYRSITKFSDLLNYHLFPWDLALLCKEVLINSGDKLSSVSLLDWRYVKSSTDKLKDLQNNLSKEYSTSENVLLELFRISHNTFRWQRKPTMDAPARYWRLFSYQNLYEIVEKEIGLTMEDIIVIGMGLLGFYQNKIALNYPPKIELPEVNQQKIDIFLSHFCLDFLQLREKLKQEQQYDDKFLYSFNSLIAYPLIKKSWDGHESIICPIPRYLYERITDGIYYETCKAEGFDHAFGSAFQEYIGDVIKTVYTVGNIYKEDTYNKGDKTVDWIIDDNSSTLFIECKTKRLTSGAKAALLDISKLLSDLDILADAVVQVYKTMDDYKKGSYPHITYDPKKRTYPVIVTLEEWFVFGDLIVGKINEIIMNKLRAIGLNEDVVLINPYLIVSTATFEKLVYFINVHGIDEVLKEKSTDVDKKFWDTDQYLHDKYPSEISNTGCPFVQELEDRIDGMLDKT